MSKTATQAPPAAAAAQGPEAPPTTWDEHVRQTLAKLHSIYLTYVRPLEDRYKYDLFRPSWFEETILNQRPFVTFFGPYSAGKSTFINHLLQANYLWTGPQPTTAEFTVIVYGEEPGPLDGRVLVNAKDLPFKGLNEFGESFLQNFQGFQAPHEILKAVTLIDTPGVLESAKEIHQRKYDYIKLSRWFAERSDLIFVMFDPTKLDAGMELKMMFKHAFKGIESKVRIVLNKADTINTQELMRVYGSLFWNLSNMINSTEPPRVYVGSFWDQPYAPGTFHLLFSEEKTDLIHELTEVIPAQALDKKIASLIRRAKEVFVHAIIIGQMRQELPMLFGKEKAKRKALDNLNLTYEKVGGKYKMNWRDFPPAEEYRTFLDKFDLESFPELEKVEKEGLITAIRNCIETVLPRMLRPVKATTLLDPRSKEQRQEIQGLYQKSVRDQFEGKQGIQGSSDVVKTGIRGSAIQQSSSPQPQGVSGGQQQPSQQQQQQLPPQLPQQVPMAPNAQQQQMQQMLAMMMQMQQQGMPMNPQMMSMMMQQMAQPQPQMQQPMMFPSPAQPQPQLSGMFLPQQQQPSGMFLPQQQQQPLPPLQQPSGVFTPQQQQQPVQQQSGYFAPAPGAFMPQNSMAMQREASFATQPAQLQPTPSMASSTASRSQASPQPPQFQDPVKGTQSPALQPVPTPDSASSAPTALEQQQQEQQLAMQRQLLMMQQMMSQQPQQQQPVQQPLDDATTMPSAPAASQYDDDDA